MRAQLFMYGVLVALALSPTTDSKFNTDQCHPPRATYALLRTVEALKLGLINFPYSVPSQKNFW